MSSHVPFVCLVLLLPRLVSFDAQTGGAANACLLTSAEFAKFSGGNPNSQPEAFSGGTVCTYDENSIYLFSGKDARTRWDKTLQAFGMGAVTRTPVASVGDSAYSFGVSPKDAGQTGVAFVVFDKGAHTVAVSITPPPGKPAESVREQAIGAARLASTTLK
jgi:hypothetical protein